MCDELNHNACSLAQEVELKAELEALDRETWQRRWQAEIESRENIIRDIMLEKSHLWADKQFLEAECAALRAALSSAAYYYEPATTVLAQSDAGSALLKRLQAAEAVCEAFYSDYFEAINTVEDEAKGE